MGGVGWKRKGKSQTNETKYKTNNSKTHQHNIEQATVESQHITNTPPKKKQNKLNTRSITVPRTPMGGVGWKRKAKQTTTKRYTKQRDSKTTQHIIEQATTEFNTSQT